MPFVTSRTVRALVKKVGPEQIAVKEPVLISSTDPDARRSVRARLKILTCKFLSSLLIRIQHFFSFLFFVN